MSNTLGSIGNTFCLSIRPLLAHGWLPLFCEQCCCAQNQTTSASVPNPTLWGICPKAELLGQMLILCCTFNFLRGFRGTGRPFPPFFKTITLLFYLSTIDFETGSPGSQSDLELLTLLLPLSSTGTSARHLLLVVRTWMPVFLLSTICLLLSPLIGISLLVGGDTNLLTCLLATKYLL